MYIAIDVILVAVMLATIYRATKQGFVLSLFSLLTVGVSLVTAWIFYKELGAYINTEYVCGPVDEYIRGCIENILSQNSIAFESGELASSLPEGLISTANLLGVDIVEALGNIYVAADELVSDTSASLSNVISNIIAFALIFFSVFVILKVLSLIINKFAQSEKMRKLNMFFGFLLGTLEALVLGVLISKVAIALLGAYGAFSGNAELLDAAQKTVVAKFLVSNIPW